MSTISLLEKYNLSFVAIIVLIAILTPLIFKSNAETKIILNHVGQPIKRDPSEFVRWKEGIKQISNNKNVYCKLSPTSAQLSEIWKPWIYETINMFGVDRCMFESNFPVDKGSCSYGSLWNNF